MRQAFTLIELLVVIAIIAVLSVVVILTLNPSQLLAQARDSNRVSELATINNALGIYSAQGGTSFGSANTVYVSVSDPVATSSQGDQCQGLSLPALPAGDSYFCGASSTFRRPTGAGWIPVNLSSLAGGSPLGQLPVDAVNQTSSNLYYTYATNGSQFLVTAIPESQKYKAQYTTYPSITGYPEVLAAGTNSTVSPLFNTTGLVGYWNFEEGGGTTAIDSSGYGNQGAWFGATPYYTGGKVGTWSGNFTGTNTQINVTVSQVSSTADTVTFWMNPQAVNTVAFTIGSFSYYLLSASCAGINSGGNVYGGALPATNQWTFVAMVLYNGNFASNGTTLYYNGVPFSSSICAGGSVSAAPNSTIVIGAYNAGYNFTGPLDDVRVYSRALSAAEIGALYNAEK